jgi:sec-independent protein translocase protein TatC
MQSKPKAPSGDREQTFIEHLVELRTRLLRSLVSVLVVFIGLSFFANDLYTWLARPLMSLLPAGTTMIATGVAAPFMAPFKLTIVLALFLALPYVLYQVWRFVAPGLYRHEQQLLVPFIVSSTLLFYLGVAFAYFAVFPVLFGFFTSTAPEGVAVMTDINSYLDFVLSMFVAFGLVFEIPVATVLLVRAGIVERDKLKELRPYVIVSCFVVGGLLTPPDVVSQSLLAVPMWLLYETGVLVSGLLRRRDEEAQSHTIKPPPGQSLTD